jgi:acetyltransferase-like isoleucine patch superfamily enzyme
MRKKIKSFFEYFKSVGFSLTTWYKFIKLNFFSNNVISRRGFFLIHNYSRIGIHKKAKVILNSPFILGIKQLKSSHIETRLLMEENSKLTVNGSFGVYCNSYIRIIKGGHLILNGGFINENVQITCASKISIGKGCTIARDVIIRDYDAHTIEEDGFEMMKPITIGNNVFIGPGVHIYTATHPTNAIERRTTEFAKPVQHPIRETTACHRIEQFQQTNANTACRFFTGTATTIAP